MKYLKLYEDISSMNSEGINFDDWDEEEFDTPFHIKKGDILKNKQILYYWNYDNWYEIMLNTPKRTVDNVLHSSNINASPNGSLLKKTPDDSYLFSLDKHWPWFRYDKNIEVE